MVNNLQPPIGGLAYLYGSNAHASVSSRFVTTLTMHLTQAVLTQALSDVLNRFPMIAVGVVEVEGERILTPLSAPVRIFDTGDADQPFVFGDPALNGYLFKVSMNHKTICFDFYRAIIDEYGIMSFVSSVIYRYLELSGYPVANDGTVNTVSSQPSASEYADPMSAVDDMSSSRPVWYMDAKAVSLPSCDAVKEDVVQIRIPISKLKGDKVLLASAPVTYLAPLFSHSLNEVYGDSIPAGQYIVASIQINLRPYFPTASLKPFTAPVFLAYNRNLCEYPFNTVIMSQKKLLEAQLKPDTLAYSAQRKISDICEAFCRKDAVADKISGARKMFERIASMSTYEICRIGNVILPESMQRYVTEFYPVNPSGPYVCSLSVVTYRGEVVVTVCGGKDTGRICGRFVEQLLKNNIEAFISDEFSFIPMDSFSASYKG